MKLYEALEAGKVCGLLTWEESIRNIVCHSTMLFAYSEIANELAELKADCGRLGYDYDKAFDVICISALDRSSGKVAYFKPNVLNDPVEIAKAIDEIITKGYDHRVES